MPRLFRFYQRKRIVNINVNIVAAGLLALIPTTGVVWASKLWIPESGGLSLAEWQWTAERTGLLWIASSGLFTAISLASDIVFDVIIYYLLHWVANHWRPFQGRTEKEMQDLAAEPPPFMRDASLIQFERALLSPVYYLIAAGLMQFLQDARGMRPGFAVLIAFPAGLLVTRIAHTIWGLRSGTFLDNAEREAKRRARAAKGPAGATPPDEQAAA